MASKPTASRLVTLLTDFGTRDPFVGVMKGVILGHCPEARFVDLTHEIPPGEIRAGALALRWAAPFFPEGTVHLAVVDPGVGGPRRPLVLRAGSIYFVGPDNGLLWPAAEGACGPDKDRVGVGVGVGVDPLTPTPTPTRRAAFSAVEAWTPDLSRWDRPISATFHGRDVFAPAAARLAAGEAPETFCLPAPDITRLEWPRPRQEGGVIHGEVIYVDRFGNAITNLAPDDLGTPAAGGSAFSIGGRRIPGPSPYYGSVPVGETVVVLGSAGLYEVTVNQGDAAADLGLRIGTPIEYAPLPFYGSEPGV